MKDACWWNQTSPGHGNRGGGGGGVLGGGGGVGARLAVPVRHDEARRLVPPVEHQHQQQVPHLVAGAQVVQLPWGGTTEEETQRIWLSKGGLTFGRRIAHRRRKAAGRLTWEVAFRDFRNVEEKSEHGHEVHPQNPRDKRLKNNRLIDTVIDENVKQVWL